MRVEDGDGFGSLRSWLWCLPIQPRGVCQAQAKQAAVVAQRLLALFRSDDDHRHGKLALRIKGSPE